MEEKDSKQTKNASPDLSIDDLFQVFDFDIESVLHLCRSLAQEKRVVSIAQMDGG